jgi:hypothetical protein
MALTFTEAYVIITDHLQSLWDANVPAIVGIPDPDLRYQDIELAKKFEKTGARFVMDSVTNPQASLRNGEHGQRYENNGIIIVQCLVLRTSVEDNDRAQKLAEYVQSIFRDPAFPGCFIFRNVRINRLEPEANFYRRNVALEYQFDEIT